MRSRKLIGFWSRGTVGTSPVSPRRRISDDVSMVNLALTPATFGSANSAAQSATALGGRMVSASMVTYRSV
jgi:hypothetical protein